MLQLDPLELLAQDTLVPVTFPHGGTNLAPALDPGSASRNLVHGAACSIPIWLIKSMHWRNMIQLKLPTVYQERYRRRLNAGAECMSFKNLAPYFYEVGNRLNVVMGDVELAVFLARTFKTRYRELVSKGLNLMSGEEGLKLSSKLCTEEQQLFEGGRVSVNAVDDWWIGESSPGMGGPPRKPGQHPIFKRLAPDGGPQNEQDPGPSAKQQRVA